MKIIGLTGGVASGKNEVAKIFTNLGAEVFDADKIVHDLYLKDQKVIDEIKKIFPKSYCHDIIDRKILSNLISNDLSKIKELESIIHPIIRNRYQQFIKINQQVKSKFIVLNIPLLLEKNYYQYDFLIAIITNEDLRKKRFIERYCKNNPNQKIDVNNILEKFNKIKNLQIDDQLRLKKADYVIENNKDLANLKQEVIKIYKQFIL